MKEWLKRPSLIRSYDEDTKKANETMATFNQLDFTKFSICFPFFVFVWLDFDFKLFKFKESRWNLDFHSFNKVLKSMTGAVSLGFQLQPFCKNINTYVRFALIIHGRQGNLPNLLESTLLPRFFVFWDRVIKFWLLAYVVIPSASIGTSPISSQGKNFFLWLDIGDNHIYPFG